MKIHCCYTPAHRILFETYFRPSLPADLELVAEPIELEGPGDFLSSEFLQCIRRKIRLIQTSLDRNRGDIILWSDVDIRFHRPVVQELEHLLEESARSILFQREDRISTDVNTGFFVCRCNGSAATFWELVETELPVHPDWNEQLAANTLIRSGRFTDIGYLPRTYYARTHGWPPPRDLRIHHANYTRGPGGVEQKIAQFREVDRATSGSLSRLATVVDAAFRLGPSGTVRAVARRLRTP